MADDDAANVLFVSDLHQLAGNVRTLHSNHLRPEVFREAEVLFESALLFR
jgi:hypothetical protein